MAKTIKIKAKGVVLSDGQICTPGFLTIEKQKITSLKFFTEEPDLDLSHMLVFPGFANAHCHLELTHLGPLEQKPFTEWVELLGETLQSQDKDHSKEAIQQGLNLLKASGVTTVLDHFSPMSDIKAYKNSPLRVVAFGEALGTNFNIAEFLFNKQKENQKQSPVDFHISPHGIYSLHAKILKQVMKNTPPFSIHISESKDEKQYFEKKSGPLKSFIAKKKGEPTCLGNTPIDTLTKYDLHLTNSLVIHGNNLTPKDMETLKDGNNCVVHCPGAFEFFKHDHFPLENLQELGIPVALGTDSLAGNFELNFLHEIQLFLRRYPKTSFSELLPMVTTNALETIGIHDVGKIAEGYFADLFGLVWDGETPARELLEKNSTVDFFMSRGVIEKET